MIGAGHLAAFNLQPGFHLAMLETAKSHWHRPRSTGGSRLIGLSVAYIQVFGVDVAEARTDLFPWDTTAITHRPRTEVGEDLVHGLGGDDPRFLSRIVASYFCKARRNANIGRD